MGWLLGALTGAGIAAVRERALERLDGGPFGDGLAERPRGGSRNAACCGAAALVSGRARGDGALEGGSGVLRAACCAVCALHMDRRWQRVRHAWRQVSRKRAAAATRAAQRMADSGVVSGASSGVGSTFGGGAAGTSGGG